MERPGALRARPGGTRTGRCRPPADQRVADRFRRQKATREWLFDKIIAVENGATWSSVQVSNRQKTSGFGYGSAAAAEVQFRLELAAVDNDTVAALQHKYTAAPADQDRLRPVPPPRALDSAPPPG